jgi:predicted O-methyltransferase YrrM
MVGVDVVDMNLNGEIYIEDTDTFFTHFKENIDMAFIDADHRFESAKRDFMNCFNLLSPGGIIILHDTDPEKDELFSSGYCGDSYKIVDYLENEFLGINILTLPLTEAGLSIVTKKSDTRTHRRSK